MPTLHEFLLDEYSYVQYRLRFLALARKLELDHIDPTPRMKAAGGEIDRYFITWDGHINPMTHSLIAQLLADEISASPVGKVNYLGPQGGLKNPVE